MDHFAQVFTNLQQPAYLAGAVLFVAFFATLYYFFFKFLKTSGATAFIKISVPLLIGFGLALLFMGGEVNKLFLLLPLTLVLFAATVYSVEFKSAIWRRSKRSSLRSTTPLHTFPPSTTFTADFSETTCCERRYTKKEKQRSEKCGPLLLYVFYIENIVCGTVEKGT